MLSEDLLKDISTLIESALKAEYDRGRLDGVKAGFKDGYDDAISAIVAAVKADKSADLDATPNAAVAKKTPTKKRLPIKKPAAAKATKAWAAEPAPATYEDISVFDLGLTTRTAKALSRNGIGKVGELIVFTASDLRSIPRFGKGALVETITQLKKLGLELKS
jgi:DNA-directed RNA polymerase alpha subunit